MDGSWRCSRHDSLEGDPGEDPGQAGLTVTWQVWQHLGILQLLLMLPLRHDLGLRNAGLTFHFYEMASSVFSLSFCASVGLTLHCLKGIILSEFNYLYLSRYCRVVFGFNLNDALFGLTQLLLLLQRLIWERPQMSQVGQDLLWSWWWWW